MLTVEMARFGDGECKEGADDMLRCELTGHKQRQRDACWNNAWLWRRCREDR